MFTNKLNIEYIVCAFSRWKERIKWLRCGYIKVNHGTRWVPFLNRKKNWFSLLQIHHIRIYIIMNSLAVEWWFMYWNQTPTLRNLVIKVLSQTVSSSTYERNWSMFALIHTKQWNRLAYAWLEQLVFCYYNMKLKLRDMEAENDRVVKKDYLDLLDISTEVSE